MWDRVKSSVAMHVIEKLTHHLITMNGWVVRWLQMSTNLSIPHWGLMYLASQEGLAGW